jgi:hypothetical protein
MNGHNVGVIQAGQNASLSQIGLHVFQPARLIQVRYLDGDKPVQVVVVGQIDSPEAAFA